MCFGQQKSSEAIQACCQQQQHMHAIGANLAVGLILVPKFSRLPLTQVKGDPLHS